MTPVAFTIDETLIVAASRLHLSRYRLRFFAFILICAVIGAMLTLLDRDQGDAGALLIRAAWAMVPTLALGLVLALALHYLFFPFIARRNFRQQKALAEPMLLSWTDDEYCYTTGKSRTVMPFAHLYGYRRSDSLILLYLTNVLYLVVPVAPLRSSATETALVAQLEKAGIRRL